MSNEQEKERLGEVIESMVFDSVGPDKPLTDEALRVAEVEVGARILAAQEFVRNPRADIDAMDTKAMFAAWLIEKTAE